MIVVFLNLVFRKLWNQGPNHIIFCELIIKKKNKLNSNSEWSARTYGGITKEFLLFGFLNPLANFLKPDFVVLGHDKARICDDSFDITHSD